MLNPDGKHTLLILSRHARDYHRLIEAARLPRLDIAWTSDAGGATPNNTFGTADIVLGEPTLLRQALDTRRPVRPS